MVWVAYFKTCECQGGPLVCTCAEAGMNILLGLYLPVLLAVGYITCNFFLIFLIARLVAAIWYWPAT